MSDLASSLARLYALSSRGMTLGLDRVRDAAERLGGVHRLGRYVHVAGTNGKGSTAAMVASMARQGGATVGLYTSPHLCRFAERIQVDGAPIDDDLLTYGLDAALSVAEQLTFFEVATLAALVAFRERGVNLPVLEVGLGGRLDATNVVEGRSVPLITRIAFDHTELLGKTLGDIAREKAGILRPEVTAIVGPLHPDARASVDRCAAELGATVYQVSSEIEGGYVGPQQPPLPGQYQRANAMVAVAAGRALGLSHQAIVDGLKRVKWPGRCEALETAAGFVLLDCAHNADGALALKNALHMLGSTFSRKQIALVFGAMADKNWRAMLDRLASAAAFRVYVEPPGGRAPAKPADLAAHVAGEIALGVAEALDRARQRVGRNGLVVVTGSIFLVGHVRSHLLGLRVDPHVGL